jgi:hypothetical protein
MMRSVTTTAIILCSIGSASAQQPSATGAPPSQAPEQQICVYAGESYSEGAEFCVTSHAGLKCEGGKWSRDTLLDCAGEAANEPMMPQGDGNEDNTSHMMPDQDHMMPDHMMHQ